MPSSQLVVPLPVVIFVATAAFAIAVARPVAVAVGLPALHGAVIGACDAVEGAVGVVPKRGGALSDAVSAGDAAGGLAYGVVGSGRGGLPAGAAGPPARAVVAVASA